MKKSYLINGKKIKDRKQVHEYLRSVFKLPDYYGRNLDALWDCLSSDSTIKKITIIHTDELKNTLGDYSNSLMNVFIDLSKKKSLELNIYTYGRKNETK